MIDRIADGRTDLVFDWLAGGGSPTAANEHGTTLLQWCAHHGDVSAIRHLLNHGPTLADLGPNFDLNGAIFHGHWQLAQFLIERGANVDHPLPGTGETPLHSALCKTDRRFNRVLKILLDAGANPNVSTNPGVVTDSFMRDIRTRGETPLHRAAAFADAEAIKMLLAAGATVDARDANGDTPLTWASWHLRPREILRLLVYGQHRA
jgi:uncharacterized protein